MRWLTRIDTDRSNWTDRCAQRILELNYGLTDSDATELADALFEIREPEDATPEIAAYRLFNAARPLAA